MKHILVIGQTPPPFGGQALMIERLLRGRYKDATLHHVRMAFSKDIDDNGRFRFGKLLHPISIVLKTIYLRVRYRIEVLYYPPSGPEMLPLLRDIVMLLCVRWMFRKTIFHFHAAGVSDVYPRLSAPLRLLFQWSFFKPDLAIQLSPFNPDDAAVIHSLQTRIVPNGIEDEFTALGCPARPSNTECRLLWVGYLRESKGILMLIEAILRVVQRGVAVKVVVVGKFSSDVFQAEVRARIAALDLDSCFDFKGVLTGRAKFEQYAKADIFCFPTFFAAESFGLVAVEAMQFGVPVIASRWRGVQSVVTDGEEGFLVPPQDSEALADRIALLVAQPDLRAVMGARGRQRYLAEFTVERFQQRMDECFGSV